jgi:Brp/Blh family beta-carotene 15,15'-monooxygenase
VFTQVLALATLVALVGMPHGGLDHLVGRALLRPFFGSCWACAFVTGYLTMMVLVLTAWVIFPVLTLTGFVLLSAVHFGTADTNLNRYPGGLMITALLGGMVVWVPALFQPSEFGRLLTWVVPRESWLEDFLQEPRIRSVLWCMLFLTLVCSVTRPLSEALRVVSFAGFFALVPPLVGFLIYFCGWHSPIELLRLARQANPEHPSTGLGQVLWNALPLSALAVGFGIVGWIVTAGNRPLEPGVVRVVFVGLSVVAVPHMLLSLAAERRNVNPFAIEGVR